MTTPVKADEGDEEKPMMAMFGRLYQDAMLGTKWAWVRKMARYMGGFVSVV